jgi:excisionase family DNA binding protein
MTDLITSADAARQLGYTVQHVRRLMRQGILSGVKMGRDWLVQQCSVQELMARRENLPLPLEEIVP